MLVAESWLHGCSSILAFTGPREPLTAVTAFLSRRPCHRWELLSREGKVRWARARLLPLCLEQAPDCAGSTSCLSDGDSRVMLTVTVQTTAWREGLGGKNGGTWPGDEHGAAQRHGALRVLEVPGAPVLRRGGVGSTWAAWAGNSHPAPCTQL